MARGKYRRRREARQRRDGRFEISEAVSVAIHRPPFRAPDVKDGLRKWRIEDSTGTLAEHAASRDKARARARELNGGAA